MRHNLARAMVLTACVLAACDSGGNAAPDTLATTPPTASLPPATTGTSAASTVPETVVVDDGTIALSPDGPWRRVDSAPGVTLPGLVYELMPGLWVWLPTKEDIPNGITWVLNETDLPIIEAYLQARLVFFRATNQSPMDFDDPGWSGHYVDGSDGFRRALVDRDARGEVFSLDAGVVLRPAVLGEQRSDVFAVVFDCMLDGSTWRLPDGSVGEGSSPGVSPSGIGVTLQLAGSTWKVDKVASQPDACA